MKKQSKLFLTVVIIIGVITAFSIEWSTFFPSSTWKYKMTVVVETPEGLKTGSAVREVIVKRGIKLTPESSPHVEVKGEAIAVDLEKRGTLFALMGDDKGPDYAYQIVFKAFPYDRGGLTPEGIKYYSNLDHKKNELSQDLYPKLVTFKNLSDSTTVQIVYPKNLEATFGKSVKLNSIQIEMTDEEITNKLETVLPEFGPEFWQWFKNLSYGDPRRISPSDFN